MSARELLTNRNNPLTRTARCRRQPSPLSMPPPSALTHDAMDPSPLSTSNAAAAISDERSHLSAAIRPPRRRHRIFSSLMYCFFRFSELPDGTRRPPSNLLQSGGRSWSSSVFSEFLHGKTQVTGSLFSPNHFKDKIKHRNILKFGTAIMFRLVGFATVAY